MRYLATQAMIQAQYFSTGSKPPEDYSHYGLHLDLYTHFTSPIRRYADLVVGKKSQNCNIALPYRVGLVGGSLFGGSHPPSPLSLSR